LDGIALGIFTSQIEAICDEMGAVLQRAAFSPNIKDRRDYSCAIFDCNGKLCAQAAHVPVHLGSMAYAMQDIVGVIEWRAGDMVVLNDPFMGGTHLPDVTVIAPVFFDQALCGFVVNRAHHANIGAESPGSMPVSTHIEQEGVVIPPSKLVVAGQFLQDQLASMTGERRLSAQTKGDFAAQISANRVGMERLSALIKKLGEAVYRNGLAELNAYGERLARAEFENIADGEYSFTDFMDDDGAGNEDIVIQVTVQVRGSNIRVDFSGTAQQVAGNINCSLPVTAAAVYYVFRCLLPAHVPACAGIFAPIDLQVESGCLVNANWPAAVAAGNVETSTRIVDVVLGALARAMPETIPAASHGSMNNVAMGVGAVSEMPWDYYETIGGGMGAGPSSPGLSAVQTHMTNTLNTPIESLEMHYPLRVNRYQVRRGSGGLGQYRGGDGIVREFEFLTDMDVTLLTERRRHRPWGLAGGEPGQPGSNWLDDVPLPGKCAIKVRRGQRLRIESAGGGGWGNS
jgi:N-methylhydantoinase B